MGLEPDSSSTWRASAGWREGRARSRGAALPCEEQDREGQGLGVSESSWHPGQALEGVPEPIRDPLKSPFPPTCGALSNPLPISGVCEFQQFSDLPFFHNNPSQMLYDCCPIPL